MVAWAGARLGGAGAGGHGVAGAVARRGGLVGEGIGRERGADGCLTRDGSDAFIADFGDWTADGTT